MHGFGEAECLKTRNSILKVGKYMNSKNNLYVNYYCTWSNQVYFGGSTTEGRDLLDHEQLFGEKGWCRTLYPTLRKSLLFLLDDGWELPYSNGDTSVHDKYFGSQRIFDDKFPGYGDTPKECLKTMVENIKSCGWAGAGIWICAGEEKTVFDTLKDGVWSDEYWIERLEWSKYAGIAYWKIDWGPYCYDQKWRRFISRKAKEIYPELIIEHVDPEHPLNDIFKSGHLTTKKLDANRECLSYSDVYRTYDVSEALTTATTFDRVAELLVSTLPQENESLGFVNCEDQLYMGAALGLSVGIMRFPELSGYSQNEVERAMNFINLAPAFSASSSENTVSDEWLQDEWFFRDGETWKSEAFGKFVVQTAPSSIARNTVLPEVSADGEKPFVSVCKNPNGVFSIGTYRRTNVKKSNYVCKADITAFAGDSEVIGIFGEYKSLKLVFNELPKSSKIMASDLMLNLIYDITNKIQISENTIVIPGNLIHEIGLSDSFKGDSGDPGMLLKIIK